MSPIEPRLELVKQEELILEDDGDLPWGIGEVQGNYVGHEEDDGIDQLLADLGEGEQDDGDLDQHHADLWEGEQQDDGLDQRHADLWEGEQEDDGLDQRYVDLGEGEQQDDGLNQQHVDLGEGEQQDDGLDQHHADLGEGEQQDDGLNQQHVDLGEGEQQDDGLDQHHADLGEGEQQDDGLNQQHVDLGEGEQQDEHRESVPEQQTDGRVQDAADDSDDDLEMLEEWDLLEQQYHIKKAISDLVKKEPTSPPRRNSSVNIATETHSLPDLSGVRVKAEPGSPGRVDPGLPDLSNVRVKAEPGSHRRVDPGLPDLSNVRVKAEPGSHRRVDPGLPDLSNVRVKAEPGSHRGVVNPGLPDLSNVRVKAEPGSHRGVDPGLPDPWKVKVKVEPGSHRVVDPGLPDLSGVRVKAEPGSPAAVKIEPGSRVKPQVDVEDAHRLALFTETVSSGDEEDGAYSPIDDYGGPEDLEDDACDSARPPRSTALFPKPTPQQQLPSAHREAVVRLSRLPMLDKKCPSPSMSQRHAGRAPELQRGYGSSPESSPGSVGNPKRRATPTSHASSKQPRIDLVTGKSRKRVSVAEDSEADSDCSSPTSKKKRVAHRPPSEYISDQVADELPRRDPRGSRTPSKRVDLRRKSSGYESSGLEHSLEDDDNPRPDSRARQRTAPLADGHTVTKTPSSSPKDDKSSLSKEPAPRADGRTATKTKTPASSPKDDKSWLSKEPLPLPRADGHPASNRIKTKTEPEEVPRKKKLTPRELRVLPPAKHAPLVPAFDMRSPLFVEDTEPRRSYSSSHVTSGTSDSSEVLQPMALPTWWDKLISDICWWKAQWFEESKIVSPAKIPDVLKDGKARKFEKLNVVTHFASKEEYVNYFYEAMLLDLWSIVCKDNVHGHSRQGTIVAVDSALVKPLKGQKKRKTFLCHYGVKSNKFVRIKQGDLVLLKANKMGPLLGYVIKGGPCNLLSKTVKLSSEIDQYERDTLFKASFQVATYIDDFPQDDPKTLEIFKIKSVYEEIETFKFLYEFENYILSPLIYAPVYSPRVEPQLVLQKASDIRWEKKKFALSIMQDIVQYETPSISVVEGGPGTGKTHLLAALSHELIGRRPRNARDCRVIIAAKSNRQVNSVVAKLLDRKKKDADVGNVFKLVRLGNCYNLETENSVVKNVTLKKLSERYQRELKAKPSNEKKRQLEKDIKVTERKLQHFDKRGLSVPNGLSSYCAQKKQELALVIEQRKKIESQPIHEPLPKAEKTVLAGSDILATTVACNFNKLQVQDALSGSPRKHVVLMVDDASEVTEPAIIKLIVLFNVTDVVLFGDTKQNVPFVPNAWARNAGLAVPLMTRYKSALQQSGGPSPTYNLTVQYRMCSQIIGGLNKHRYDGEMVVLHRDWGLLLFRPYLWLNCTYIEEQSYTLKCQQEAEFICKLWQAIKLIHDKNGKSHWNERVKVVSFCKTISLELSRNESIKNICEHPDHLAGLECDMIILSCGPSLSYRTKYQRITTALTRARKSLIVCGNFTNIRDTEFSPLMLSLLKDSKQKDLLEDITEPEISIADLRKVIEYKPA